MNSSKQSATNDCERVQTWLTVYPESSSGPWLCPLSGRVDMCPESVSPTHFNQGKDG